MSIEPDPTPKKPRVRRTVEASRDNILSAAEALLAEGGPQSLKILEVARAAEVSPATLIHHFGSIDGVQTALMSRMIRNLVKDMLELAPPAPETTTVEALFQATQALFEAFDGKAAARLAAWLELTGESRRLTLVKDAVVEVVAARRVGAAHIVQEEAEDFALCCVCMAMGAGLFGRTLSSLMGKPENRAREMMEGMLRRTIALKESGEI
jgi:AcrR family transcriptional regulator